VNSVTNRIYVSTAHIAAPSSITVIDGATGTSTSIPVSVSGTPVVNEATNKIYAAGPERVVEIDGRDNTTRPLPVDGTGHWR
jgi:DNA-binding beta-propeller fold protein YncE